MQHLTEALFAKWVIQGIGSVRRIDRLWADLIMEEPDVFCPLAAAEIIAEGKLLAPYVFSLVGDFQAHDLGEVIREGHRLIQDIVMAGGEDDLTGLAEGSAAFFFQGLPGARIV